MSNATENAVCAFLAAIAEGIVPEQNGGSRSLTESRAVTLRHRLAMV
jgi:hypothetical protein